MDSYEINIRFHETLIVSSLHIMSLEYSLAGQYYGVSVCTDHGALYC